MNKKGAVGWIILGLILGILLTIFIIEPYVIQPISGFFHWIVHPFGG